MLQHGKWHVIQSSRAQPDAAVVIVGSCTTERSALTALRRMRRTGLGAGDPDTEVGVRRDDQITSWMSYDVTAGRTVTHHGPPSLGKSMSEPTATPVDDLEDLEANQESDQ